MVGDDGSGHKFSANSKKSDRVIDLDYTTLSNLPGFHKFAEFISSLLIFNVKLNDENQNTQPELRGNAKLPNA